MIHGRNGALWASHLQLAYTNALKRLGGRNLVYEMQIDIKDGRAIGFRDHHMTIPNFIEQRSLVHSVLADQETGGRAPGI